MDEIKLQEAIANPQNMGEMPDADAIGTVGSPDCGDMLRMWIKYGEKDGQRVIDKASFQSFGCQTAIAVASMATQLIQGKTREEALQLRAQELAEPLGTLPPMKIHCGQMVEGALRAALQAEQAGAESPAATFAQPTDSAPTLSDSLPALSQTPTSGKLKIVFQNPPSTPKL